MAKRDALMKLAQGCYTVKPPRPFNGQRVYFGFLLPPRCKGISQIPLFYYSGSGGSSSRARVLALKLRLKLSVKPMAQPQSPIGESWECLSRKALAFLRLASIRLMLRKLCIQT
jgi:hypothetical protein